MTENMKNALDWVRSLRPGYSSDPINDAANIFSNSYGEYMDIYRFLREVL